MNSVPLFPMVKRVKKIWGIEYHLHNDKDFCTKILIVNQGCCCSIHWHKIKREIFIMQSGKLLIEVWNPLHADYNAADKHMLLHTAPQRILLMPEQWENYIFIEPYTPHRFTGLSTDSASFIECSTQDFADDSYRAIESQGIV